MWDFTEKDKAQINTIYNHFLPLILEVSKEQLYNRIYGGYCYGEGGFRIMTIEDWKKVFGLVETSYSETVFENWEDWIKYNGDYHKKREDLGNAFGKPKVLE